MTFGLVFNSVRERLGEEGLARFIRENVEALKRRNAGIALRFLGLIRAISPGTAFSMTAKKMAYQLQWLSPYSVPELSRSRLVLDLPRCKLLDYADSDDLCLIGCQQVYPMWVAEQFKVNMQFDRQGTSCKMLLAPSP
ncbi:MAG: hypothetical protein JXA87_10320 [Thermoleophilia bacterium]|nr:hypothetical protein [Thermoleophilia bacterium]